MHQSRTSGIHPERGVRASFMRRGLCRAAIAAALMLQLACSATTPLLKRGPEAGPQWPEAPFKPRIMWVKSVAVPEDAGISRGFWTRALELVTGARQSGIVKPYGVLYDDAGRLIIADPGAGVVHLMLTKEGRYITITGSGETLLRSPIGLAEDRQGFLYITDSVANAVYRYSLATGEMTTFLRALERPTGIAYSAVNNLLYVSETNLDRVLAVDLHGTQKQSIGAPNAAGAVFNHPTDLAVDRKGQLYVVDPLNYKVHIYTPEGQEVSRFGGMGDNRGEFDKPKGVAVDREGRIYLCDSLLDAVQIFDDEGRFLFSFGATGTDAGAFWMPSGIYLQGAFIFVADTYNRRVQIFKYISDDKSEDDVMLPAAKKFEVAE